MLKSGMESMGDSKDDNTIADGTSLLANQNITVAQKRQKKPTAPVLQRIRPISKRKKFKKSLGPDFLEPAELGMQYLRDTYEPKCDICSLTMFSSSTSLNVFEELLHCNNCDAKAHPSCVNLNEEVAHKTQWQCHNCKVCTVCHRNDTNEFVIICMTCSKGFHVKCHTIPIVNKPKGNWHCKHCCSKGSSHSSQVTNGLSDKKVLYSSDNSLQSEDETEVTTKETEVTTKEIEVTTKETELNRRLELVLDTESKCEVVAKDRDNSDVSSDDLIDEQTIKEDTIEDIIDNNRNGFEGIEEKDLIKDKSNEEEVNEDNDVNGVHINSSPRSESGELNQTVIPSMSPQKWSVEEVEAFIRDAGFPSESLIFKEQEIDGRSLLLLRRMDVLTGLSLKLGPALKIYNHISRLQRRHSSENSC